jgi:manganese/zinc/iron transport system permease protein
MNTSILTSLLAYNTLIVLAGVAALGAVSGLIGAYMVLRRRALVGDALAHAALPGIFLAFALTGDRRFIVLLAGAFVFALLGAWLISAIRRHTRVKEDAALGVVLSVLFGLGVALLSWIQNNVSGGNKAGLDSFFYGKPAGMIAQDVWTLIAVGAVVLALVLILFKEFRLLSFDPQFALVQGWPVFLLDLTMMALVCLVTVIGLPAVGVVMMAGMLIIPAAAARFWTDRLRVMLALSVLFGVLTGLFGTIASALWPNLPAGPMIILTGAAFFVLSMLLAPRRGLAARGLRAWSLRRVTARQNLLRTLYELSETHWPRAPELGVGDLLRLRAWRPAQARRLLNRAEAEGFVTERADGWRLTEAGWREAAEVTRTHRLWEIFLLEETHAGPGLVDRAAERIEHVLPRDLVDRLERRLRELGLLPPPLAAEGLAAAVPPSPHDLPTRERNEERKAVDRRP